MQIGCTKKLLDELKITRQTATNESSVFSWSANILFINHRKTIVLTHNETLYTLVIYGVKMKEFKSFAEVITQAVRETFLDEFLKKEIIDQYLNGDPGVTFTKINDKRYVARLNKACSMAYYLSNYIETGKMHQRKLNRFLNNDITSIRNNRKYSYPYELLFLDLEKFAGQPLFSCKAAIMEFTLAFEKYPAYRKVVVPVNITFDQFHDIIQKSFKWNNSHLHEFILLDKKDKEIAKFICYYDDLLETDKEPIMDTDVMLGDYMGKFSKIIYNYDFGDSYTHEIRLIDAVDNYQLNYPTCIEFKGLAPIDDFGGEGVFEDFMDAFTDMKNKKWQDAFAFAVEHNIIDNKASVNDRLKEVLR